MEENTEKMFSPTTLGWLNLTTQRLRGKGKEDPEIKAKFKQMKKIRKTLKKIEEGLITWNKKMKAVYKASKKLAIAVETDKKVVEDCQWTGKILIKDNVALKNIQEKIRRLDELLSQRKLLTYIRLKGEQAQQKLEKLRKNEQRESYERQSTRYLSIHKEAVQQQEDIMSQVLVVIDKCLEEVNEYGTAYLVKPQLQSFKMAQFHMFLVCQKLIQGKHGDAHLVELEEHWNIFTNRVAEEMPQKQHGGSLDGNHPFPRQVLEGENELLESDSDGSTVPKQKEKNTKAKRPSMMDSDEEDSDSGDEDASDAEAEEVDSDGEVVKSKI